jgi:transposase-like protein
MDLSAFETWLGGIAALTGPQRRQAWQALALSETADSGDIGTETSLGPGASRFERTEGEPQRARRLPLAPLADQAGAASVAELGQCRVDSVGCPHCNNRDVVRWGQASDVPRYRCKVCRRTFNALTKTPLANLRMKDKWAAQTEAMIDGVSTAKAAQRCGVHYTTAFRWRHRFLAALAGDKPQALTGIVEGDERPSSWNRSRASVRAYRESLAREAANRPSVDCPPNKSRSSLPATVREPPRMPCCRD